MAPSHPIFPLVKLTLDRERNLLFNNAAKIAFEEETGLSTLGSSIFGSKFSAKTMRALLWAGFRHEDQELTLEQAGELLDIHKDRLLTEITKAISEAWMHSLPQKKKEAAKDAPANPPEEITKAKPG